MCYTGVFFSMIKLMFAIRSQADSVSSENLKMNIHNFYPIYSVFVGEKSVL